MAGDQRPSPSWRGLVAVIEPRPYQKAAREAVRGAWAAGTVGALLVMATGTGKTATGLSVVVWDYLAKGHRVVWLAHREELLHQPIETVRRFWPDFAGACGLVQAENHTPGADLVFASVATLATSPERIKDILEAGPVALLVVDECHHSTSPSQRTVIEAIGAPRRLGLTATPDRVDGADLSDLWEIVYSYSILDAIEAGALVCPWAHVDALDVDLDDVGGVRDYVDHELAAALLAAGVVDHTVSMMRGGKEAVQLPDRKEKRHLSAAGRSCLVFTATIDQAKQTAAALRADGWTAVHISGETPKRSRRRLLRDFREGRLEVLVNAAVLTEGTDLPRASCVVLARPTRSWPLFIQMIGRVLRPYPGKDDALVLDMSGATQDLSILSAPVLIGRRPCLNSPSGVHSFTVCDDPQDGAVCDLCGRKVACSVSLGPHKWDDAVGFCVDCARPQCIPGKGRHSWVRTGKVKRECGFCGAQSFDPLAGLVSDRGSDPIEADWVRVPDVHPETWAANVGRYGMIFATGSRVDRLWSVYWLKKGARKLRPLQSKPGEPARVRGLADDVVRRAPEYAVTAEWKGAPPTRSMKLLARDLCVFPRPGETAGDLSRRVLRVTARQKAIKYQLAKSTRGRH